MKILRPTFPLTLCLGLALMTTQPPASAQSTLEMKPAKDLREANASIHWPNGFGPKEADAFVHNEIVIHAPARVVWDELVRASAWPSWYSNSADVQIAGVDAEKLGDGTEFKWKTFGFPVASKVAEFVPPSRLGWTGEGGQDFHAYHTWLIVERADGCLVVTEEIQRGAAAVKFNLDQPTAMFDGHRWWTTALKVRCERAAGAIPRKSG